MIQILIRIENMSNLTPHREPNPERKEEIAAMEYSRTIFELKQRLLRAQTETADVGKVPIQFY